MYTTINNYLTLVKKFINQNRKLFFILLFITIWIISSLIFYLRFPNNFTYPNFFAEDGQHFAQNIINKGFFGGLLTLFNGYFIFGIYILTGLGFVINSVFFHGDFVSLPGSLAIISYAFFGLCATLPIALLRNHLTLPYRISIALLITVLPFPSFDYGTIGTIGNVKFAFNYIAFLLILFRATLPQKSYKFFIIDFILFICAFTTAGVYLILPFIALSKNSGVYAFIKTKKIKTFLSKKNISLWSAVVLAITCCAQVMFIVYKGIPKFPGYLDQPYEFAKTIEVFIARSYLYPFISAAYRHLNDIIVVILFITLIIAIIKFHAKKNTSLYLIGLTAILTTSLVFIINRTGTVSYYNNYTTSGFDNFFYAQNFIAIVIIVALLSDISKKYKKIFNPFIQILIILILLALSIKTNISYAPNDFMQYQIGTIQEQTKKQCSDQSNSKITFSVYPFTFLKMTEPRSSVCNSRLYNYQSLIQYNTANEDIQQYQTFNIYDNKTKFTQTFVANQDKLSRIGLYISSYGQTIINNYQLKLMDGSCNKIIQTVPIPRYVRDNAFRTIELSTIENSKNTKYCFTVEPNIDNPQKFALQLSTKNNYKDGVLKINNTETDQDIIFNPIYK